MKHQPLSPAPQELVSPFADLLDLPMHPRLDDGDSGDDSGGTVHVYRIVLVGDDDPEDIEPEDQLADPPRSWIWIAIGLLLGFGAG